MADGAGGTIQNENEPPEEMRWGSKGGPDYDVDVTLPIPSIVFTEEEDLEREGDQLQSFLPPLPPQPTFSAVTLAGGSSASSEQGEFNIEELSRTLESCLNAATGEINIDRYLDSFREICKLLDSLGTVIRAYIGGDIRQKIGIIRKHQGGANGHFYDTIERMIVFEKRNKIHKKNVDENGSRTILRLHRSLYFIADFLRNLNKIGPDQEIGGVGRDAYNRTLAQFHPWAYKKIARFALSTLGEKGALVSNFHDGSMTPSQLYQVIENVVCVATRVCNQCQAVYEKHNFLDLP